MINILKRRKYDKMQYDKDFVVVYHIAASKYKKKKPWLVGGWVCGDHKCRSIFLF